MIQVSKVLTIIVFISAVTACGVNQTRQPPPVKLDRPEKTHDIQVSFNFDTTNDQAKSVSGFRLYKGGKRICETTDPRSKSIDCDFTSPGGSFLFTMTTYFEDGSESAHSEPFSYTIPD